MKKTVIGILAHVDAGKTTLTEAMLYLAGKIKNWGRVDHGDAFFDYNEQERQRGITIFSKQTLFQWENVEFTLVDTPGHSDFSTEMERTLQILDYAILVISGPSGVQSHSETIWQLLKYYQIPTFIFINKMDITSLSKESFMSQLNNQLDDACIDFSELDETSLEKIALSDETILEDYLATNTIDKSVIAKQINDRHIFPCFFGSALKMEGIEALLDGLSIYLLDKQYPKEFGAKIYKITRDEQGNRLTHMKITGGSLKVKRRLFNDEKVDQIRKYTGNKFEMVDEVFAGEVCAVKGLQQLNAGVGLGWEQTAHAPVLTSYMEYRILLPSECDPFVMLKQLQELVEEDPQLHIHYLEEVQEIRIQLMGEIQTEILKNMIKQRFNVDVEFDHGSILYKETILAPVIGVGHFEPLRHYAEVHLLLEPGEVGSGLVFKSKCKEDTLSRHWQRLIISHLEEKEHLGVLTGSPITDMTVTLMAGRAHLKHTEGGDFRQATYRAIRQGLKLAQSILLEPYYQFQLEIPNEFLSRAIFDIEQMNGQYTILETIQTHTKITGKATVLGMQHYQNEVISYTKGKGRLSYSLDGYYPCYNQEALIAQSSYDSESDISNPTSSVFCAHGAGFNVPWNQVEKYQHIKNTYYKEVSNPSFKTTSYTPFEDTEKELEQIFTRTYGQTKVRLSSQESYERNKEKHETTYTLLPECLLVDGYNIIHAWPDLKELAIQNLGAARSKLMDIMCNYQGYKQCTLIIVFDAYKVKGNIGTTEQYHNIHVVYTKEAQTADAYIERATHQMTKDYQVIVATSDALEQLIVAGHGSRRISARELLVEVERLNTERLQEFERKRAKHHHFPLEDVRKLK